MLHITRFRLALAAATCFGAATALVAGTLLAPAHVAEAGALSSACAATPSECGAESAVRRFVATAVQRENVADSFSLVSDELRQGMTRQEWAAGNIPVVPFPDVDWRAFSLRFDERSAGVSYYRVHLRSEHPGNMEADFWIGLERRAARWLVTYFLPVGAFGAPTAD